MAVGPPVLPVGDFLAAALSEDLLRMVYAAFHPRPLEPPPVTTLTHAVAAFVAGVLLYALWLVAGAVPALLLAGLAHPASPLDWITSLTGAIAGLAASSAVIWQVALWVRTRMMSAVRNEFRAIYHEAVTQEQAGLAQIIADHAQDDKASIAEVNARISRLETTDEKILSALHEIRAVAENNRAEVKGLVEGLGLRQGPHR